MRFGSRANLSLAEQWEPQRSYKWEVWLPYLQNTGTPWAAFDTNAISAKCLGVKFGLPYITNIRTKRWGNGVKKFPGLQDVDFITLTMLETEDSSSFLYFKTWYDSMIQPDYYAVKNDYSYSIKISFYRTDNSESLSVTLKKCFVMKMPTYNLTYENSSPLIFDVQLGIDGVDQKSLSNFLSSLIPLVNVSSVFNSNISNAASSLIRSF